VLCPVHRRTPPDIICCSQIFCATQGTHIINSPHLEGAAVVVGAAQKAQKKRRKTEDPGGVRVGFHMWQT